MNHMTLALVAVLAAAVVIGTFATAVASPAFADSSKTVTIQKNKQRQTLGDFSTGVQTATNCIAVFNDANNVCRQQGTG
jgi:hypothetical protein